MIVRIKSVIWAIKIALYYIIISKLPHSRFGKIFNKIRCWYVCKVLKIMEPDDRNYFENNVYISKGKNIKIRKSCHINENVFIQGAIIGSYVIIAPNVAILMVPIIMTELIFL